ncbi:MAG: aldo/keto reductase [Phycisphaerales bacterium]|nr:aldo/keto reductase [Phycisphaerales bacterium]
MVPRRAFGRTGLHLSIVGFGAFKIGRNEGIKYPSSYALPSDADVDALVARLRDLGVNYVDTAPAYGTSEARLGRALAAHPADAFIVSTKVGEARTDGRSTFDFSDAGVTASIHRSLRRLGRERLDLVWVHSDGRDVEIIRDTDVVPTLRRLRDEGLVGAIGFSGKTPDGARAAMDWADGLMIEYHLDDRSHEAVIVEAASRETGVVVKKGLGAGHLDPDAAVRFLIARPEIASVVIGSLNPAHIAGNVAVAIDAAGA